MPPGLTFCRYVRPLAERRLSGRQPERGGRPGARTAAVARSGLSSSTPTPPASRAADVTPIPRSSARVDLLKPIASDTDGPTDIRVGRGQGFHAGIAQDGA